MKFKNAVVYNITREIQLSVEQLEEAMKLLEFQHCGSLDAKKVGWYSPLGSHGETLTHAAGGQILLCIKREEKILPASVIKQKLKETVDLLENQQGRKLKKTEKDTLRDEVIQSLLPRAFSKYSLTNLWIDADKQRIIVDAPSSKKAEDALALLRKTLGSLPVIPLSIETPIELTLTSWVKNSAPKGFDICDEAELRGRLELGIARFKDQDMSSDEIASHLEAGKLVTKLAMEWQGKINFTITDSFVFKKIQLSDVLVYQNDDIDPEEYAERFDADFVLFAGEFSQLIDDLIENFQGER